MRLCFVACEPCTGSVWSQRVPGLSRRHRYEFGMHDDADREDDMTKWVQLESVSIGFLYTYVLWSYS